MLTKSPLRYPGGKSQFYASVKKLITSNNLEGCTYVEPFAGGAGVAIRLLMENHVSQVILNDLDFSIYSFWYSILYENDRFCKAIEDISVTIDEWKKQKEVYLHSQDRFNLGFATFFLNRTNRSGIAKANPIGGINQTGKYKIDCRFNKQRLIKLIQDIGNYSRYIDVFNHDAQLFIETHKFNNSFWFIDPPYYNKGKELYRNYYNHDDHCNLAKVIKNHLSNDKWILTYDVSDKIKDIFYWLKPITIDLNYSIQTKRQASENLFYNNINVDSIK